MTDRNTLDDLQKTAQREIAADGSEIVTVDADALAAHIDSHALPDRFVDVENDPLVAQLLAQADALAEDTSVVDALFEDAKKPADEH